LAGGRLSDQRDDFAGLGVAFRVFLGVHAPAVHLDLEDASGGLNQSHFSVGKCVADLGRQTGGPRFVVSDDAVFDGDGHVVNDSRA
jgi:hypothetical protein